MNSVYLIKTKTFTQDDCDRLNGDSIICWDISKIQIEFALEILKQNNPLKKFELVKFDTNEYSLLSQYLNAVCERASKIIERYCYNVTVSLYYCEKFDCNRKRYFTVIFERLDKNIVKCCKDGTKDRTTFEDIKTFHGENQMFVVNFENASKTDNMEYYSRKARELFDIYMNIPQKN